ncbi:Agglutinin-2 [Morella rubra]|uniref:Agglutinin-2 n=1 Tax=Morella rubra TaxID=262757 RepID=A0A6A1V6W8_9ROSI|nr:Agglutinin-2 [Morella rubra]
MDNKDTKNIDTNNHPKSSTTKTNEELHQQSGSQNKEGGEIPTPTATITARWQQLLVLDDEQGLTAIGWQFASVEARDSRNHGKDRYSDGITFFFASPDFPPPTPTDGAGIGLISRDQANDPSFLAANKFVAVEFDTFRNDEWDPPAPVHEHVGINLNSLASQNSTPWFSVIKENRTYTASISYDSTAQNLSVTFTGYGNGSIPLKQHLSSVVNLKDYLTEWVEFGFSSSTGLLSEFHILRSWSFESVSPV